MILQSLLGKHYKWVYIVLFNFKAQMYYAKNSIAYIFATLIQLCIALTTFFVLSRENKDEFLSYLWFVNFYSILGASWLNNELPEKIRTGRLSRFLLLPTNTFWFYIFAFVGKGTVASSWILIIPNLLLIPFLYSSFSFDFSLVNILAIILMYPMMYFIKFCGQWLISMLAFWIIDTGGSDLSYELLSSFLVGYN